MYQIPIDAYASMLAAENPVRKLYTSKQKERLEWILKMVRSKEQVEVDTLTNNLAKREIMNDFIESLKPVQEFETTSTEMAPIAEMWTSCLKMPYTHDRKDTAQDEMDYSGRYAHGRDYRKWREDYRSARRSVFGERSLSLGDILRLFYGKRTNKYYLFHGTLSTKDRPYTALRQVFEKKQRSTVTGRGKLGPGFYTTPFLNLAMDYALMQRTDERTPETRYNYVFVFEIDRITAGTIHQGDDYYFHDRPYGDRRNDSGIYREILLQTPAVEKLHLVGIIKIFRDPVEGWRNLSALTHSSYADMWRKQSLYRFNACTLADNFLLKIMWKLNPSLKERYRVQCEAVQSQNQQQTTAQTHVEPEITYDVFFPVIERGRDEDSYIKLYEKMFWVLEFNCTIHDFLQDTRAYSSLLQSKLKELIVRFKSKLGHQQHKGQQSVDPIEVMMISSKIHKTTRRTEQMMFVVRISKNNVKHEKQTFDDKREACHDKYCVFASTSTKRHLPILVVPPMRQTRTFASYIDKTDEFTDIWVHVTSVIKEILQKKSAQGVDIGGDTMIVTDDILEKTWKSLHNDGFYIRVHGHGVRHTHVRLEKNISYPEDFRFTRQSYHPIKTYLSISNHIQNIGQNKVKTIEYIVYEGLPKLRRRGHASYIFTLDSDVSSMFLGRININTTFKKFVKVVCANFTADLDLSRYAICIDIFNKVIYIPLDEALRQNSLTMGSLLQNIYDCKELTTQDVRKKSVFMRSFQETPLTPQRLSFATHRWENKDMIDCIRKKFFKNHDHNDFSFLTERIKCTILPLNYVALMYMYCDVVDEKQT